MNQIYRVFIKTLNENEPSINGLEKAKKSMMIVAKGNPYKAVDYYYCFLFSLNRIATSEGDTMELIINGVLVDFSLLQVPDSRPPLDRWLPLLNHMLTE